jgi:DNA-binding response OmpR family regulator
MGCLQVKPAKPRHNPDRVHIADWTTHVLSVSSVEEDHGELRRIVEDMPFRITVSFNCQDAANQLDTHPFGIVVCDCKLQDGAWNDLLRRISRRPEQPLLIVSSRLADDFLWAEVLNLGGFDLLVKPFIEREVRHVLTTASTHLRNHCRDGCVVGAA